MTLRRPYRRLKTIYRTKVKVQAHFNFLSNFLDFDVIPRGLVMQKTPVVPEVGDVKRLLSIGESTLQKTSHILFNHLKHYYTTSLLTTNSNLRQEESKLRGWTDFEESLTIMLTKSFNYKRKENTEKLNGWRRQRRRRENVAKLICRHHQKTMEANVLIQ